MEILNEENYRINLLNFIQDLSIHSIYVICLMAETRVIERTEAHFSLGQ